MLCEKRKQEYQPIRTFVPFRPVHKWLILSIGSKAEDTVQDIRQVVNRYSTNQNQNRIILGEGSHQHNQRVYIAYGC